MGRDAKKRKSIVLFTPGKRIQLQGKRIPFTGRRAWQPGLTTTWRGCADKKAECSLQGQPVSWQGLCRQCDFSTGRVATPFSCLPILGFYVSSMPLPSRLCTTLPGKRRIIVALLQHFLHGQSPFQGCVGWVCSACSILGTSRTSLHMQAHENPLNIILLSEKLNRLILSRTATGEHGNKWR